MVILRDFFQKIVNSALFEVVLYMMNHDPCSQKLGGGFKYFLFSTLLGGMIQFDEHIFQGGGSTTNLKTLSQIPLRWRMASPKRIGYISESSQV